MRATISFLLMLIVAQAASAATVLSARYDKATRDVIVEINPGPYCQSHHYSLDFDSSCAGSVPAKTSALLVDSIISEPGTCDVVESEYIRFKPTGISCAPAYLTIHGDDDSAATVLIE